MVASTYFTAAVLAFAGAVSASALEEDWIFSLLKRQEPGTPAYACHEACGTAITASRGADPCNTDAFVNNYNSCLACAGPSDINIWRYYGATLSVAGGKCGFPTTPTTSTPEPTIPTAPEPQTSATVAPPPSEPTPVIPDTTPVEPPTAPTSVPTHASESLTVQPDTTTIPEVPATTSTAAAETVSVIVTESSTVAPAPTVAPSGTIPAGNGTSTTSTPVRFTGGADSQKVFGIGAVGAALLALMV